ncbi:MAG: hypothetical protein ACRDP5_07615, partial [Streptosporangiaceae bacterium]
MLPHDRAQPAAQDRSNLVERFERATARASLPRRVVMVVCGVLLLCPVLAPVAVVHKVRTRMATAYVAVLAVWLIYIVYLYGARPSWPVRWGLIALPVAVAVLSHVGRLGRWRVPCRTAAVVLVWPVLVAIVLNQLNARHISTVVGVILAWLLAAIALGWRLAKVVQDQRMDVVDQARNVGPARKPGLGPAGPMPAGAPPAGGRFQGHP